MDINEELFNRLCKNLDNFSSLSEIRGYLKGVDDCLFLLEEKGRNISPKKSLSDYTWEEIIEISQSGVPEQYFTLGDTKNFVLGKQYIYTAQIVGFHHDDLTDDFGKAGISFAIRGCSEKRVINYLPSNEGGWEISSIRDYLNKDIFEKMPKGLREAIKPVRKVTAEGNVSEPLNIITSDRIWLFSEREVLGDEMGFSVDGEGEQYAFFKEKENRKKCLGKDLCHWWLRSSAKHNGSSFCFINSKTGGSFYHEANYSYGIVWGFAI